MGTYGLIGENNYYEDIIKWKSPQMRFCKHWYDPTNAAIEPAFGKGMWRVDTTMKNKCLIKNILKLATGGVCNEFVSKF